MIIDLTLEEINSYRDSIVWKIQSTERRIANLQIWVDGNWHVETNQGLIKKSNIYIQDCKKLLAKLDNSISELRVK